LITKDDYLRVFYIRKLIGSGVVKCEEIFMTLEIILGLNDDNGKIKRGISKNKN
jgi:hypothetical protein